MTYIEYSIDRYLTAIIESGLYDMQYVCDRENITSRLVGYLDRMVTEVRKHQADRAEIMRIRGLIVEFICYSTEEGL